MSNEKEALLNASDASADSVTIPSTLSGIRSPQLISDASWSLVSNLGSVVGGLATIKIITSLVSVQQYGQATLALGVVGLISFFTVNPLFTAHLRIYFDHLKTGSGAIYLKRLRIPLLLAASLGILIYGALACGLYLEGDTTYLKLIVPVVLLMLLQPLMTATVNLLEAHRKFRSLALANIVTKVGQVPILALLIFGQISGSKAIVLAQAFVIVPVLFLLARELRSRQNDFSISSAPEVSTATFLKGALRGIGWPLVLANIVGWVFTTSDRYLLEHFRTITEVGVYAANYGLWSIPFQILNGWIETVVRPRLYTAAADQNSARMKQILRWRTGIGLACGLSGTLMLLFVGQPLALFLLGPKYWFGKQLMIIIAAAHVLYVVGSGAVSWLIADKRLTALLKISAAAAASNVILNLFLLPRFGILGAGWSTLGSYFLWVVLLAASVYRAR